MTEGNGRHGVGLAMKVSILQGVSQGVEKDGLDVEYISARLMKVRLNVEGEIELDFPLLLRTLRLIITNQSDTTISCGPHYAAQQLLKCRKESIYEYVLVMMDANARTGRRGEGRVDGKVMGAYGQGARNDNGRRLLAFSAENQLALVNKFYIAPERGISYTLQAPKISETIATAWIVSSRGK